MLANRCLADRTNAWTETDHTCYTVYTAGSAGFLNILPIYMDHILYPLLREDGFVTEVHHITSDGEDAGVVYSEMQAKENRPATLLAFQVQQMIYPGANSSYHFETGGKLRNLRESTTIEKVREYHRKYYRPENLYLTITGHIALEDLFLALDPIETKVLKKRAEDDELGILEKPFQRDLPDLLEDEGKNLPIPQ